MSEVISFRLNKGNPREAQAHKILHSWITEGYSVRYVITEAIIKLGNNKDDIQGLVTQELIHILDQFHQIQNSFDSGKTSPTAESKESHSKTDLSDAFITSIKKGARTGIKS